MLQPFLTKLVKVGVREALTEYDNKVKSLQNTIDEKNFNIRELEHEKVTLETRLKAVADEAEEKKKMLKEIERLKKDISSKKSEVTSLNKKLEKEKALSKETMDEVTRLKIENNELKGKVQQAKSGENVANRKLKDLQKQFH